jgi:hypothetical protein
MPQVPALHASVAWFVLHALVQEPQWFGSELMLTSQPLAGFPSQSANPGLQTILQTLFVQTAVLSGPEGHALLQEPQLPVLLVVLVSQPLAGLLSQLPQPGTQVPTSHVPAPPASPAAFGTHVAVAFGRLHALPHEPQLFVSLPMLVSQPVCGLPLQLAYPGLQDPMPQTPFTQLGVSWYSKHTLLHMPQLSGSLGSVAQ